MTLTDSDLARIKAAIGERDRARARLDRMVLEARDRGATWTELGYALGMTAQGAQKRYGSGSERAEAHRERAAARAVRKRQKADIDRKIDESDRRAAAKANPEKSPRDGVDPWPDGSVQATLSEHE